MGGTGDGSVGQGTDHGRRADRRLLDYLRGAFERMSHSDTGVTPVLGGAVAAAGENLERSEDDDPTRGNAVVVSEVVTTVINDTITLLDGTKIEVPPIST